MKLFILINIVLVFSQNLNAQTTRWQQRVTYKMDIDMDVVNNQYKGKAMIAYTNNSPDNLNKIFVHAYWNAFQPKSSMDIRSLELNKRKGGDWDPRVMDRISKLKNDEIGYIKLSKVLINNVPQKWIEHETIIEIILTSNIKPNSITNIIFEWDAQVPLQVRRAGRDNPQTGVKYSMSQWYPKICEYDQDGWHPNQYIAREFYGIWGDYDVSINIDKTFKLGGTGILSNAKDIGWGYDKEGTDLKKINTPKRKWNFTGKNIHDFVWAADQEFTHIVKKAPNNLLIHVLYNDDIKHWENAWLYLTTKDKTAYGKVENFIKDSKTKWETIGDAAVKVIPFIEKNFGKYPYPQYSFIQGGDGGMEYPMATLIATNSIGTAFHEWMHSWYQMMLGTDESQYAWMDEGFTEYATNTVEEFYRKSNMQILEKTDPINAKKSDSIAISTLPFMQAPNYNGYYNLVKSGLEEPLSTHADHFNNNRAYSNSAYSKGCVFMEQLGYIVGAEKRNTILLKYYDQWAFKHPTVNDLIRLAEKESNIELDWYKDYFINTTKTINYSIDTLVGNSNSTSIRLKRIGDMPMPVDLQVTTTDNKVYIYYIPMNLMYNKKTNETNNETTSLDYWKWVNPFYNLEIPFKVSEIKEIEIDPTQRMADIDRKNNKVKLF